MAAQNIIKNLQDVKTWLGTLTVGQSVDISSSMFDAAMVNQIFTLLPDSDPISLTPTEIDIENATLTGKTSILGETDTTAVLAFSQPDQQLLCTATFTPPDTLQWSLLSNFHVVFGGLTASMIPNSSLGVLGLDFAAEIKTTNSQPISIPVNFSVPTFNGDWILSSSRVPIGELTNEALTALGAGIDVTSILPAELVDLKKLKLTNFEMAFNFSKATCSLVRLGMEYDGDWQFFNKQFTVQSVNFDFEVLNPFSAELAYDAKLYAKMQITGLPPFDVGGQFPDKAVFVQLAPDSTLYLNDVFTFLHLPVPGGMPNIGITTLSFTFFTANNTFDFKLAIAKPVPLFGSVSLDSFLFDIGASNDPQTGKISGSGALYAHFTIAKTQLMIAGSYSQNAGLDLIGQAENIPLGELIADIAAKFGIDANSIPAPIRDHLALKIVRVELNTGKSTFDFMCIGTTTVSDVVVDFTPTIHLTYASNAFSATFSGTLVLHVPKSDGTTKDLTFSVIFSTSATDTWIEAKFSETNGVVQFEDIAAVFHVGLPAIPSQLDLALDEVGFRYDFSKGTLTFGTSSQNYGKAVFASLPISNTQQYFFLLDSNQSFSLSNLPLVGQELAKIENISISKLMVIISTLAKVDKNTAGIINKQITDALSTAYPQLPDAGIDGKFILSASLNFGTETLPLSLSLGGSGSAQTDRAAAALVPAASIRNSRELAALGSSQVVASSSSDGITWFNVQKSFGPVSINRIGALYQSEQQALWFELDATLKFGPLTLDLVGLGIGSPLKSFAPMFDLQGLGVSYSNPPLQIAGALINLAPPGSHYIEFEGGVIISTGNFTVQAFGYYGDKQGFSSMFLFGDIQYPFGGPPAFFVTGVALGFGYNSNLRIPTIDQVQVFPFVQVLGNSAFFGPNPTPTTVLDKMLLPDPKSGAPAWVSAQQGSLWFAAGITFTSFELVNSQAMVFVEIGPDLVIALIGVSRAQFPQQIPDIQNQPVYAYIELDLEVRFAPTEGVFSLEAVLAASSFLLDKACVLTGGFAFYVWFGSNPHAGDFVLSLGGYHPGFVPPDYYPRVPRVGFHWSPDSSITIQGGTYFAFTPAALMVGGALNATYQSGNLKAWFDAHADIIVRWKPFWFDAAFGITIGASYKINLLFTSATVSVELGVDLEIWGPPTGGTVTVDWYIISFTVRFGSSKESGQQIKGWNDGVQAMLPNTGTDSKPNVLSLTPTAGLTPTGTTPGDGSQTALQSSDTPAPWLVRGGQFGFSVDSPVPATTVSVGSSHSLQGKTFDVYPLHWKDISAAQTIHITDASGKDVSSSFEVTQTEKDVPASLWGAPPQTPDGKPQVPSGTNQLVPGQTVGVSVLVNAPQLGNTAGPITVGTNLAYDNLDLSGAVIPISEQSQPQGDIPVRSDETVAIIANPDTGIASQNITAARNQIFDALTTLHYAPETRNDPMTKFAQQIGCALSDEPLLVS